MNLDQSIQKKREQLDEVTKEYKKLSSEDLKTSVGIKIRTDFLILSQQLIELQIKKDRIELRRSSFSNILAIILAFSILCTCLYLIIFWVQNPNLTYMQIFIEQSYTIVFQIFMILSLTLIAK